MSKYDKTVSISREEEGSYHRREYETSPVRSSSKNQPITTYTTTTQSYPVARRGDTSDEDNFEEWTTSKRKVNHKTRQVETRVSRQLLVEDGKVIADSGPQVTTRIKEDNKVEECEKEKAPKNKGKFDAISNAPECSDSLGRVLGEKKEIQRVSREVREENMQYHDERFKELTGHDVHRRAIQAPHELITITDKDSSHSSKPRGKMVHYSNKGKKYQDTDEILEVAKLAIDGSITKEVKRTKHHEEFSEDEKPDEKGEAEELRLKPKVERSSRRHADYVNDWDDTATPSCSSDEEYKEVDGVVVKNKHRSSKQTSSRRHHDRSKDDEAFPRYEIDPLLNSLKDEDFAPTTSSRSGRYVEHSLERNKTRDYSSSDDEKYRPSSRSHHQQVAVARQRSQSPVEIPDEYRVDKSRRSGKTSSSILSSGHNRERSFSPNSKLSQKSNRSHSKSYKEDASVQAHLTDEEIEKRSMSSDGRNSHEKTTRKLQRQSTGGSKRNYYFGDSRKREPSVHSVSSSSSSSLSDPKERMRKQGVRSRDSGFRSPHSNRQQHRTVTPTSTGSQQQIYSVSSKHQASKDRDRHRSSGAISPTPTTGSVGQRSVKTTTTTMSAGLADRPLSRSERSTKTKTSASPPTRPKRSGTTGDSAKHLEDSPSIRVNQAPNHEYISGTKIKSHRTYNQRQRDHSADEGGRQSLDSISLSSLGPNATTIKVPYRRVDEHETDEQPLRSVEKKERVRKTSDHRNDASDILTDDESIKIVSSEMSFQSDLENLSKRLEEIKQQDSKQHFDYKTIVLDVTPASQTPNRHHQVVDAYNVHVIEHNSPFHKPKQSMDQLSSNLTQLELTHPTNNIVDNNNEANFILENFVKEKPIVGMSNTMGSNQEAKDDDQVSLVSSCSMKSTRTYDIRSSAPCVNEQHQIDDQLSQLDQEIAQSENSTQGEGNFNTKTAAEENSDERRPAAWIFDLRDGSSTEIAAPARPKKPEVPQVDSKTEELSKSRGGQSYYLELVERERKLEDTNERPAKKQHIRVPSTDSLHSRWNSHGNLTTSTTMHAGKPKPKALPLKPVNSNETRCARQIAPAGIIYADRRPIISSASNSNLSTSSPAHNANAKRRQLPFNGSPLANKSKSSSCLLTTPSTRSQKYSIYGGLKRADGTNKPVPRLSYSRTIGPKSQRQIDAQPKTPSRYLKLK